MTSNLFKKKNNLNRKVFRRKYSRRKRSIFRQSLEAILMLLLGIFLLDFINSIPNRTQWIETLKVTWSDLIQSLIGLLYSLITLMTGLFVVIGIALGFILILGGTLRILRLINFLIIKNHNNNLN